MRSLWKIMLSNSLDKACGLILSVLELDSLCLNSDRTSHWLCEQIV